jgi:hypothetical protein
MSQQYDGYVRPGGLFLEKRDQRPELGVVQRFVGNDRHPCALVKLFIEIPEIPANVCPKTGLPEQPGAARRVGSVRRENERAQG